jgi:hypothetical protein
VEHEYGEEQERNFAHHDGGAAQQVTVKEGKGRRQKGHGGIAHGSFKQFVEQKNGGQKERSVHQLQKHKGVAHEHKQGQQNGLAGREVVGRGLLRKVDVCVAGTGAQCLPQDVVAGVVSAQVDFGVKYGRVNEQKQAGKEVEGQVFLHDRIWEFLKLHGKAAERMQDANLRFCPGPERSGHHRFSYFPTI